MYQNVDLTLLPSLLLYTMINTRLLDYNPDSSYRKGNGVGTVQLTSRVGTSVATHSTAPKAAQPPLIASRAP
jgi:hypothetical protein